MRSVALGFIVLLMMSCSSFKPLKHSEFSYSKFTGGQEGVVGYKYSLVLKTKKYAGADSIYIDNFILPVNEQYNSEKHILLVGEIYKKQFIDLYEYFNSSPKTATLKYYKNGRVDESTQQIFQSKTMRRH